MQVRWSYVQKATLGVVSALAFAVSMTPTASAQDPLVTALKKKYRVTEINSQGVAAIPGTVFTVEADGINAEPYPTMITFENPVVDGQVKQRSKGFSLLKSNNLQILQPGQKVYITKIHDDTQGKEDALKVTFLTTDPVMATFTNGTYGGQYQAAKRYSGTLSFKEPKGALGQMSVEDASKLIEAILSVNAADQGRAREAGVVARSCEPHCAVSATTGATIGGANVPQAGAQQGAQAQPQASAQSGNQTATQTVALGQTIRQVTATMGAPTQIVDLGSKKIYRYSDMKVIFIDGKVSDVQ